MAQCLGSVRVCLVRRARLSLTRLEEVGYFTPLFYPGWIIRRDFLCRLSFQSPRVTGTGLRFLAFPTGKRLVLSSFIPGLED